MTAMRKPRGLTSRSKSPTAFAIDSLVAVMIWMTRRGLTPRGGMMEIALKL